MTSIEQALVWAGAIHALVIAGYYGRIFLGMRRIRHLDDLPSPSNSLPSLSIVVAARNEERDIEPALLSLLALDYAPLEIIVVNDRSTDATGHIAERISQDQHELSVVHLESLPDGWLGKNHAMQQGAMIARGDYILFTDADVVFEPDTLRQAVAYAEQQQLDMLAAFPSITMPSLLLESFVTIFAGFFVSFFKPWSAPDPVSTAHVGVGAFNLVRADAYRAAGMHEPIRMRPDDDIQLGKMMKKAGNRLEMISATGRIRVQWYASVKELVVGLEKNVVAGFDYRLSLLFGLLLVLLGVFFWPFVAVLVVRGDAQLVYLGVVGLMLILNGFLARQVGVRVRSVICLPLAILLSIYIFTRNTFLTYRRGGIRWRDTHYSLEQLRANKT